MFIVLDKTLTHLKGKDSFTVSMFIVLDKTLYPPEMVKIVLQYQCSLSWIRHFNNLKGKDSFTVSMFIVLDKILNPPER